MANKKPLLLAGIFMGGAVWYYWGVPIMFKDTLVGNQRAIEEALARDLKRDFGFTDTQVAGIIGNLAHESGGFKHFQEINPLVPGSRGGYGYAQWTGKRRREFEAFAKAGGDHRTSYAANYGFLKQELATNHANAVTAVRRTDTVDGATLAFEQTFLYAGIKHYGSRIQRANHTYKRLTGGTA